MSWVTDIILIFNVNELLTDDGEMVDEAPALISLNEWLIQKGRGPLDCLDEHAVSGGKPMQACVYGGAYNFLNVWEFVMAVKAQAWREPENVQLLIQDEDQPRFTMYRVGKTEKEQSPPRDDQA